MCHHTSMKRVPLKVAVTPPLEMLVQPDKDKYISTQISNTGLWEPALTWLLTQLIEPGHQVIDVGANIGYYSLILSRLVGQNGTVHAFEPDPINYRILEANVKLNACANVFMHEAALGNRSGEAELSLAPENLGDHRLFGSKGRETVTVKEVTGDATFASDQLFNFIKVDTQGYEVRILRGLSALIKKNASHLFGLIEFAPGLINEAEGGYESWLDILEELGATCIYPDVSEDRIDLIPMDRNGIEDIASQLLDSEFDDLSVEFIVFFSQEARAWGEKKLGLTN